jgi:hypothetical protein
MCMKQTLTTNSVQFSSDRMLKFCSSYFFCHINVHLYTRKVINLILSLPEQYMYVQGLSKITLQPWEINNQKRLVEFEFCMLYGIVIEDSAFYQVSL